MTSQSLPGVAAGVHRVEEILRLADLLGIARAAELVCPSAPTPEDIPAGNHAVIHAAPMFRYKQWTMNGWRELAAALTVRALSVISTGGPAQSEREYLGGVVTVRRCVASMGNSTGRSLRSCWQRPASISGPILR